MASRRTLSQDEKLMIGEMRVAKERKRHPSSSILVTVLDETDDEGEPVVHVTITSPPEGN